MLKDTFVAIRKTCSGQAAKDDVAAIICHHRTGEDKQWKPPARKT